MFLVNFVNTNTMEGCLEDFHDATRTLYRVVLIMINIKDMTQYRTTANTALLFGHVIIAATLGILFLNFVIAFMTMRVSTMSQIKDVMIYLNALPVALLDDARTNWVSNRYPAYFRHKYLNISPKGKVLLSNIRTMHGI
jgi:hypothetical protein